MVKAVLKATFALKEKGSLGIPQGTLFFAQSFLGQGTDEKEPIFIRDPRGSKKGTMETLFCSAIC